MIYQGLKYVALAVRTTGKAVQNRRVGSWITFSCTFVGAACFSASAQEQTLFGLSQHSFLQQTNVSLPQARIDDDIRAPVMRSLISYTLSDRILDQFDRRSIQFYFLNEYRRGDDPLTLRDSFGRSARRRVEKGFTRTATRILESTEFVKNLKEEPWKERFFNMLTDSVTEETPTIGTPIGDDDPYVDYDVESPVVQNPAWKEKVNFFVRPFSVHPNVGVGVKLDNLKSQVKLYHDQIKFSALVSITESWNFYSSARMKDFDLHDTTFSFGFQNEVRLLRWADPAVIQYGLSVKNRSWTEGNREYDFQFVPHLFLAVGFQY